MKRARRKSKISGQTEHVYGECQYRTRKTWPWKRRVIYKAEVVRAEGKKPKDNPRFVVSNMKQSPRWLYEEVYCQRGDLENRIKELHYGMEIGRTSCTSFWANQFRVLAGWQERGRKFLLVTQRYGCRSFDEDRALHLLKCSRINLSVS